MGALMALPAMDGTDTLREFPPPGAAGIGLRGEGGALLLSRVGVLGGITTLGPPWPSELELAVAVGGYLDEPCPLSD